MLSSVGADQSDPTGDMAHYLKAKHEADEYLKACGMTYAILRPVALTNDRRGADVILGEDVDNSAFGVRLYQTRQKNSHCATRPNYRETLQYHKCLTQYPDLGVARAPSFAGPDLVCGQPVLPSLRISPRTCDRSEKVRAHISLRSCA